MLAGGKSLASRCIPFVADAAATRFPPPPPLRLRGPPPPPPLPLLLLPPQPVLPSSHPPPPLARFLLMLTLQLLLRRKPLRLRLFARLQLPPLGRHTALQRLEAGFPWSGRCRGSASNRWRGEHGRRQCRGRERPPLSSRESWRCAGPASPRAGWWMPPRRWAALLAPQLTAPATQHTSPCQLRNVRAPSIRPWWAALPLCPRPGAWVQAPAGQSAAFASVAFFATL
mmetsp:Transcript_17128/g.23635  ORF Transcript_17128/g.23635 Transcript_17128/m.23635 type:complete len:227 (-) Transcript_17128:810-1490(-)